MTATADDTPLVIISWWSNCLALACLDALLAQGIARTVCVVQVGKSVEQRERFRRLLPAGIVELEYPESQPAEHARVISDIAFNRLGDRHGIWFLDHDVFVHDAIEPWLAAMDEWLRARPVCLCLPRHLRGPAVTSPAFWMSPRGWPDDAPALDPSPFEPSPTSRRPDMFPAPAELRMPEKDTLVRAREHLASRGAAAEWPVDFPAHTHLGGLSLFTLRALPFTDDWTRATVARFGEFFAGCPASWQDVEDPTLLGRCREFTHALL